MERERTKGNGDRRKRGGRRSTVSGAALSLQNEVSTRVRASSDVMKFPWSSSPTAPASPVDVDSTPTGPRVSGQKRTTPVNVLSRLNFFRSATPGEDARSAGKENQASTSPTKTLFGSKSVDDDDAEASINPEKDKNVLDSPSKSNAVVSRKSIEDDGPPTSPTSPEADRRESALSAAMRQVKTRKRKGSLRKTALLGGKRIGLLQRPSSMKQVEEAILPDHGHSAGEDDMQDAHDAEIFDEASTRKRSPTAGPLSGRRNFTYPSSVASTNGDGSNPVEAPAATAARLTLLTDHTNVPPVPSRTIANELGSPTEIKSPQSTTNTSYTSPTTSDDDLLTFSRPRPSTSQTNLTPLSTSSGSYFPPQPPVSLSRHTTSSTSHGHTRLSSPLSRTLPLTAYPDTKTHSTPTKHASTLYPSTLTEYWGYAILIFTWLTFTVGMGSCLEVWSWAWDVEEGRVKPYVPPELSELNDDETLPIVGYYPALIVLTGGVVSWVWITVAWVGMKYFRHAKVEV